MEFNAGVMGYPVDHSLSPKIHNAIYELRGVGWKYGLFSEPTSADARREVSKARERALAGANAGESGESFIGFNVTTPYKDLAFEISDDVNPTAYIAGGANVLTMRMGQGEEADDVRIVGDSTDGEGAFRALSNSGFPVSGSSIMVLGTGGAARSIITSSVMHGAEHVWVASRNTDKASGLLNDIFDAVDKLDQLGRMDTWGYCEDASPISWTRPDSKKVGVAGYDEAPQIARQCDIVVNATPVGMKPGDGSPIDSSAFRKGQLLMDCIYAHGVTKIVEDAQNAGARTMDGLAMLVEQALITVAIWFEANGRDFSLYDVSNYDALSNVGIDIPRPSGVA